MAPPQASGEAVGGVGEKAPYPWGFSERVRRRAYKRSEGRCARCGHRFDSDSSRIPTVDHVVPKCKGGKNALANAQVLCLYPCHKNKTLEDEQAVLSHPPKVAKPGSAYYRELRYLRSRGVTIVGYQDVHVLP